MLTLRNSLIMWYYNKHVRCIEQNICGCDNESKYTSIRSCKFIAWYKNVQTSQIEIYFENVPQGCVLWVWRMDNSLSVGYMLLNVCNLITLYGTIFLTLDVLPNKKKVSIEITQKGLYIVEIKRFLCQEISENCTFINAEKKLHGWWKNKLTFYMFYLNCYFIGFLHVLLQGKYRKQIIYRVIL